MLWMMGYDFDHVLQELCEMFDVSDSDSDEETSTNSIVSGYASEDSSYNGNIDEVQTI